MDPPRHEEGDETRNALRLVGLVGTLVAGCILTGTWAGIKADTWLGAGGVATAAGVLLGVAAGLGLAGWVLLNAVNDRPRNPKA